MTDCMTEETSVSTTRTSRVPTRRLLGAGLGLAALALTGCGSAAPGVAATIGDDTISVNEVDETTRAVCAALEAGLFGDQGGPLPTANLRVGALELLVVSSQARQIAEEYGVEPGADYDRQVASLERAAAAAGLSDEHVEGYVRFASTEALSVSVIDQVGEQQLIADGAEDPTVEDASAAGTEIFTQWPQDQEIEFDPRFGVGLQDGGYSATDTGLSVPVSETAQRSVIPPDATDQERGERTAAYAASLPSHLTCGG